MNYIHQLQEELAAERAHRKALEEGLNHIMGYLHSSKFWFYHSCNVNDIVLRIRETESAAMDARLDARYKAHGI
jgi:hypothetical protein